MRTVFLAVSIVVTIVVGLWFTVVTAWSTRLNPLESHYE
jgi:hypothetical protein